VNVSFIVIKSQDFISVTETCQVLKTWQVWSLLQPILLNPPKTRSGPTCSSVFINTFERLPPKSGEP